MRLVLHPDAVAEATAAGDWYDAQRSGLGADLEAVTVSTVGPAFMKGLTSPDMDLDSTHRCAHGTALRREGRLLSWRAPLSLFVEATVYRPYVIAATLLLCGCSLRTSVNRNLAAVPPSQGIVVFSTGAEETSTAASIGLRLAKATTSALSPSSGTDIVIDYSLSSSDFPDEHGRVRMLELEEGEYCLRPASMNPYLTLKGAPDIAFRVQSGRVSYIGSVFLARGRKFQIRDRGQRDLDIFFAGNPGLKGERVTTVPATLVGECRPRG